MYLFYLQKSLSISLYLYVSITTLSYDSYYTNL